MLFFYIIDNFSTHLTFAYSLPSHLKSGKIKMKPKILSFTQNGVEFSDKTIVEYVDEVLFFFNLKKRQN